MFVYKVEEVETGKYVTKVDWGGIKITDNGKMYTSLKAINTLLDRVQRHPSKYAYKLVKFELRRLCED